MTGLGLSAVEAAVVKLDVAPYCTCTGELMTSSRLGMGRLQVEKSDKLYNGQRQMTPDLS